MKQDYYGKAEYGITMKELLYKRKRAFVIYLIACTFPVFNDISGILIFGVLSKAIQIGEMQFFIITIFIALAYIPFNFFLQFLSRLLRIKYMRDTIFDVRLAAFQTILHMSYRDFSKKSKDVYVSNLVNDINKFEKNFFVNLLNLMYRSGMFLISLGIIMFLDWRIGVSLLLLSGIIFFISRAFADKTKALQKRVSETNEEATVQIANVLNGLEIIKLNNIEERFLKNTNDVIEKVEINKSRFRFFNETQRNMAMFFHLFIILGIMIYLTFLMKTGADYGVLMIIIMLANNVTFSLPDMFPRINVIKSSAALYERITTSEYLETRNQNPEPFIFQKEIKVENLSFSYDNKTIFKDVSFTIEKGRKYLIKGPSGVGKSTLIKILSMIYDNYEGRITLDGIDYNLINERSFNNSVSFVYQDVFLFEDTIGNNVSLYKSLPEDALFDALNKSGLKEMIASRAEGINAVLEENGKNLSGGERQRISVARAIAKGAAVVFIDEGTSALNVELGRELEETFLALEGTVLNISHRYYEGISEQYDYVIEISNHKITVQPGRAYFENEVKYA